jgi:hypothetical protein
MISVAILINGKPIMARSAHRRTARHAKGKEQCYMVDDGTLVYHNPDDGAVALCIKLLQTIKEE